MRPAPDGGKACAVYPYFMHKGRYARSASVPAPWAGAATRRHLLAAVLLLGLCAGCGRDSVHGEDAQALLHEGWARYRLADYRTALRSFDRLLEIAEPGSDLRWHALYGKAVTWDLRQPVPTQNDALAADLYRQILQEAPESDVAPWCSLALARMKHLVPVDQEPDPADVAAAYQDVIDRYPRHLAGQEAVIYQQSIEISSLDPERTRSAIRRLSEFLEEQPDAAFRSAAHNLLAEAYFTLGEADLQLRERLAELESVEVDPASPLASDFSWRYWQIATTAEFLAGRFDVARSYYQKLIDEYPLDFRRFGARQALLRMDALEARLRAEAAP